MPYQLQQIADFLGARLEGDGTHMVDAVNTLDAAQANELSFLANPLYKRYLPNTQAGVVLVSGTDAADCKTNRLILDNPYLGYAKISHWFDTAPEYEPGVHETAAVDGSASLAEGVYVGPNAVIEAGVTLGKGVSIGAGCFVGRNASIGENTVLKANVTVYHEVTIGSRCRVHSGTVIGSDGFGFANDKGEWLKIAQIGSVLIGDDVEIGSGTTIDRGALSDTRIGNNVILDNQIQVAHNVEIGDFTAIAACTGIAGSTTIGKYCMIAGAAGILGHLEICDNVQISAKSLISKSIKEPGVYTSGTGFDRHENWKKNAARFKQLNRLFARLKRLEK